MDVTAQILQQPFAQVAIDVASIVGVWVAAGIILKFLLFLFARIEANLALSRSLIAALILFLVQNSFPRLFVDPTGVMWMLAAVLAVALALKILCWVTWKKSFLVSTIGSALAICLSIYVTAQLDEAIPNRRTLLADVQNSAEVLARMEAMGDMDMSKEFSIAKIKAGLTLYYDSLKQALGLLENPDMIKEMTADHTADLAELGLLAEEGEVISEEDLATLGIVYGEEDGAVPDTGMLGEKMDDWSDEDLQAVLNLIGSSGGEDAATEMSMTKAAGTMVAMMALATKAADASGETDLSKDPRTAMIAKALSGLTEGGGDLSQLLDQAELPDSFGDIPDMPDMASVISNAHAVAAKLASEAGTNDVANSTNAIPGLTGTGTGVEQVVETKTKEQREAEELFVVSTNTTGTRSAALDREEYKRFILKDEGWYSAEKDVKLDGIAKGSSGRNVAVINGDMVREGDIVSIVSEGKVFKYIARSISEDSIKLLAIYGDEDTDTTTIVPVGSR